MKTIVVLCLLAPLGALGCAGAVQELGIPVANTPVRVTRVTKRGPYLDVNLEHPDYVTRVLTADNDECRTLLTVGAAFIQPGLETAGKITGPEISCEIEGRFELDRRRQPRPPGAIAPRGQATMSIVYSDEELILARGRYPLTGLVGWARGDDSVAVLPNTPTCRDRAASGVASIEYRPSGDPLVLVGDSPESCPILGLARPL